MKRDRPSSGQAPIPVIYIMGMVRSGSTILDTILGNHPQTVSVGELMFLCERGWVKNEYCACGQPAAQCDFWQAVRRTWMEKSGHPDLGKHLELQNRFTRVRSIPRLLSESRRPSREFALFSERTRALCSTILEVSGKPILVDSSKNPLMAWALSLMPWADLRLVHLTRDCRGVAWSSKKSFQKNLAAGIEHTIRPRAAWKTGFFWALFNLLSEWVRMREPDRAVLVRYEDLVQNPQCAVRKIFSLLGKDATPVCEMLSRDAELTIGHTIAGNALRMLKHVRFRPDKEWEEALPSRDRLAIALTAGWLMKRYGYRLTARN